MKKRFLAIAIAAGLASPFAAQAEANVYGQIHLSVGTVENCVEYSGATPACQDVNVDNWQLNSHASRLGVKGSEDLGDGLSANYQLEYGVNPDSTTNAGLSSRNQWVGLKGGFGEVRFGRHDTPTKISQGKFDQFGDTFADIIGPGQPNWDSLNDANPNNDNYGTGIMGAVGDLRVGNVMAYLGKAGDVKYAIALVPGEGDGTTGGDGPADSISAAVMYESGPLYVAVAMDQYDDTGNTANDGSVEDLLRLTATYAMGTMEFGFMMEETGVNDTVGDISFMGLSFGMGMGKNKVKFQYTTTEIDQLADSTQMSLGYDWGLSKATTAYVLYTDAEMEADNGPTVAEFTFMGVGMVHKF